MWFCDAYKMYGSEIQLGHYENWFFSAKRCLNPGLGRLRLWRKTGDASDWVWLAWPEAKTTRSEWFMSKVIFLLIWAVITWILSSVEIVDQNIYMWDLVSKKKYLDRHFKREREKLQDFYWLKLESHTVPKTPNSAYYKGVTKVNLNSRKGKEIDSTSWLGCYNLTLQKKCEERDTTVAISL